MDDSDHFMSPMITERSGEKETTQSRKKKRKRSILCTFSSTPSSCDDFEDNTVERKKRKRKKLRVNSAVCDSSLEEKASTSKENNQKYPDDFFDTQEETRHKKKKKKRDSSLEENASPLKENNQTYPDDFFDTQEETRHKKKKKKRKDCTDVENASTSKENNQEYPDDSFDTQEETRHKKKKKKRKDSTDVEILSVEQNHSNHKKDRKRHRSVEREECTKKKTQLESSFQKLKKHSEDNAVIEIGDTDSINEQSAKKKKKKRDDSVNDSQCTVVYESQDSYCSSKSMDFSNLNIESPRKSNKRKLRLKTEKEYNTSGSSVQVLDNCDAEKNTPHCVNLSADSENNFLLLPISQVNNSSKTWSIKKSRRRRHGKKNDAPSLEVPATYDHESYRDDIVAAQPPIYRDTQVTDDGGLPFTLSPVNEIYQSPKTSPIKNSWETIQSTQISTTFKHSQHSRLSRKKRNSQNTSSMNELDGTQELESTYSEIFGSQKSFNNSVEEVDEDHRNGLPFTLSPVNQVTEPSQQKRNNSSTKKKGFVRESANWCESTDRDIADLYIDIHWELPVAHKLPFRTTTKKDEERLKEIGLPIKTGPWTNREVETLNKNWSKFQKKFNFYNADILLKLKSRIDESREIKEIIRENKEKFIQFLGKGLDTRTLWSIYEKARVNLLATVQGNFTPEEQEKLKKLVKLYGSQWRKIGKRLHRTGPGVFQQYKRMFRERSNGVWTEEENEKLISLIRAAIGKKNFVAGNVKTTKNLPWVKISAKLGTRNVVQCRNHWLYNLYAVLLPENERDKKWRTEHNLRLIKRIKDLALSDSTEIDWDRISSGFPVYNSYCLRRHWEALKATVSDHKTRSLPEILRALETRA